MHKRKALLGPLNTLSKVYAIGQEDKAPVGPNNLPRPAVPLRIQVDQRLLTEHDKYYKSILWLQ